jgi:hypothetical protein
MVAVSPSSVCVTVVGGCGGIAAPGICAAERGGFMPHEKRRSKVIAHPLMRPGKTVVDIPLRTVLIFRSVRVG